MKTLNIITALLISGILITSCNKEYTCTCTSDNDGSIVNISHYDLSKSDAENACSNADKEVDVTCKLD